MGLPDSFLRSIFPCVVCFYIFSGSFVTFKAPVVQILCNFHVTLSSLFKKLEQWTHIFMQTPKKALQIWLWWETICSNIILKKSQWFSYNPHKGPIMLPVFIISHCRCVCGLDCQKTSLLQQNSRSALFQLWFNWLPWGKPATTKLDEQVFSWKCSSVKVLNDFE